MTREDFVEKYGFDLEDLETARIDEMKRNSYICYSVKELAYKIVDEIYEELNYENDYYISYKLVERKFGYIHRIAFGYKDLVFIFDIVWRGSALCIDDYEVVNEELFETYKNWEDIEIAINDDEEE